MQLRAILRPPLAGALWPLVSPFRRTVERDREGRDLLPGISIVMTARDEAYTIPFCLRSLAGFADQIICIDNGSTDATVREMEAFRDAHGDEVDVDILSLPDALLSECREEGLRRTRRQWHLRWDADMVAKTSGPQSILGFRERLLTDDRPRTIHLPYVNISGDLRHTEQLNPENVPGEPRLMRFGRDVEYTEDGRFPGARVPLYHLQQREPSKHIFHLTGLKGDDNLIHRFAYFTWRGRVNREGPALDPELRTLDGYKQWMSRELFGTDDPRSLKWRYRRQLSYHLTPYDRERFGDYPEVLEDELARPQRFEVLYRDGRPWTRVDHEDTEMLAYEPTQADLEWDPEAFLRRFLNEEHCRLLGVAPAPEGSMASG